MVCLSESRLSFQKRKRLLKAKKLPEQVNCRTAQLNYLDVLQFFPSFVETRMTGFILFIPAAPLADLPSGVGRLAPCQYPQVPQAQQPQHEHGEVAKSQSWTVETEALVTWT